MSRAWLVLLVASCSTSDAEPPPRSPPSAPNIEPSPSPLVTPPRPKLTLERLMKSREIKPGVSDWDINYEAFTNWLGPVTRQVDLKYFWAVIEGDRCGIVYIAKRRKENRTSIFVAPYTSKRGDLGNAWCVAIATGGPLPPMQKTPSTGYDSPGPE